MNWKMNWNQYKRIVFECIRFTNVILLISKASDGKQEMLNDLNGESLKVGLKMNRNKTKSNVQLLYHKNDNNDRK